MNKNRTTKMNLQQYLKNLTSCNDKKQPPKNREETTQRIQQHENLQSLETTLLPVMNSLLAFAESPISFTNYSFNEFLKIRTYQQSAATTKELEDFFLTEYAKELNIAKEKIYQNTNTLTEKIAEHLEKTGTKQQQKIEEIQENIAQNNITCEQFSWLKNLPFTKSALIFSKKDYEEHAKNTRQKTKAYLEKIKEEDLIDEQLYAALSEDENVFLRQYI